MLRELFLAAVLLVGLCLIVSGVWLWSVAAALIVAGVGVVAIGYLFLVEAS